MNEINTKQNLEEAIDKLAAQNQLYGDAKTLLGAYLVLSIPVMIILNLVIKPALLSNWLGLSWTVDLTDSIALFAILLAGYELLFLKKQVQSKKNKAAKIQEDFDCTVYDLEWNDILCSDKECDIEVKKSSDKYSEKGKKRSRFNNWYTPDVAETDSNRAILLCQKENLGWDIEQRSKYIHFISTIAAIVFISSCIAAFYFEITMKSLILSAIIPSWPAISFAITNYSENKTAINDKKLLKVATDKVDKIQNITVKYVRNIQNIIYLNRANNCLVFDWFYDFLREKNQLGISYATKQLIQRML